MSRTPYSFQKLLWHMTRIGMVQPSSRKTCTTSGYWGTDWRGNERPEQLHVGDIVGQEMWHIRDGERVYSHEESYRVVEILHDRKGRVKWELVKPVTREVGVMKLGGMTAPDIIRE